jgi:hypothetical protein
MNTYGGSGCIDPRFLSLTTSCSGQLHAAAVLLPGEEARVHIE